MHAQSAAPTAEQRCVALATAEQRLAALATAQYGVVSIDQLRDFGVGRGALAHRLRAGRLHRLHVGVYVGGHEALTRRSHWMAAVLTGGEGAVLSHVGAGSGWELRASHAARIDVTLPSLNGRQQRRGLRFHWHRDPRAPDEVTRLGPIPITTPARTLLDLAAVLPTRAVGQALEQAGILRLVDHAALAASLVRRRNQPGASRLRAITSAFAEPTGTRSGLEREFLELLERHHLHAPLVNQHVSGYEVDFVWPHRRLIVARRSR